MADTPRRRREPELSRYTEAVFVPYVTLIGQIALAWSDLHEYLAFSFWSLMGGGNSGKPIGIWNSANFDRARREMLRKAAEAASPDELVAHPKIKDDIIWMLNQLDELEQRRNDVVHSPLAQVRNMLAVLMGVVDPVVADVLLNNQRARNLAKRQLIPDFTWCRDTILIWRDFAASIDRALDGTGASWPDRPSLPIRPPRRTPQQAKVRDPRKRRSDQPPTSQE
jgi:hypothetical protein